jgi:hypothetical protein
MEQKRFNFCEIRNKHIDAIDTSLQKVKLEENIRNSLIARYTTLLQDYNGRKRRYSWSFHILRIIITVGSLIVPAILSVQYTSGNVNDQTASMSVQVYWVVWTLSLFVTISNGIMSLLKMDKKYHSLHTTFEQLISEGWQFVHLSGKYYGQFTPGTQPSHENQFPFFCFYIEKVRMKHIEDEYYKTAEHIEPNNNESSYQPKTPWRTPFNTATVATSKIQEHDSEQESSTHQLNGSQTTVTRKSNAAEP